MTQEEKAKAYDRAIEKIKYVMEHGVSPVLNKEDLQDIFPELKESEDELTWLANYIQEEAYSLSMDIRDEEDRVKLKNLQRSLAWLKKQQNNKSIGLKEGENIRKGIIKSINDLNTEWLELHGVTKVDALAWLEKQVEQKPQRMVSAEAKEALYDKPKWSEEDEHHWMMCLECVEECATQEREDFLKTIDWIKSLKQRI